MSRTAKTLVIGWSTEPTVAYLIKEFAKADYGYVFLDLHSLEDATRLRIESGHQELSVEIDDVIFNFSEFDKFFVRAWHRETTTAQRDKALEEMLAEVFGYLEYSAAIVANRQKSGFANSRKLDQLIDLKNHRFTVPRSFISSDPSRAYDEVAPDGAWVVKGPSNLRTVVRTLDEPMFFNLSAIKTWPVLFQERIRGDDVRIHVVGNVCIGALIRSRLVDYRYPENEDVVFEPIEVPLDVAVRCIEYCRSERLFLCGFDFKICENTYRWYALEANPMPAFDFFDKKLEGRIVAALMEAFDADSFNGEEEGAEAESDGLIRWSDRPRVWR